MVFFAGRLGYFIFSVQPTTYFGSKESIPKTKNLLESNCNPEGGAQALRCYIYISNSWCFEVSQY